MSGKSYRDFYARHPALVMPCCWTHATKEQTRYFYFVACTKCGNKRCPHATDCALQCTESNEPGQPGSRYA